MCVFVVLRHKQRYFSYKCDGTDVQADSRRSKIIAWGKTILYCQLSRGMDNYIASYPLTYYHITNCLGKRLLYSQFLGDNTTI